MIRFGLCCLFKEENINFKTTQYRYFAKLTPKEKTEKLENIIIENLHSLLKSLEHCLKNNIRCFRIISTLLPLYTHPECTYQIEDLPQGSLILSLFKQCKEFAATNHIRTVFHPDQFVVLNSLREDVIEKSIQDLLYHAYMAELLGSDVINIHGGGVYGDKKTSLARLSDTIKSLPKTITSRLTLENDDKSYTPSDLLPLCTELGIPLVYDVHHHRCLKDALSEKEASEKAYATWNREPLFHISSPKEGWAGPNPLRHHDYIDPNDFPLFWKNMTPLTVEVEAKAKELAVKKLMEDISIYD